MSKFNTRSTRPRQRGPIATSTVATGRAPEGRPGYLRDPKGELFLLAVSNMVGQSTFYETDQTRDARYNALIHHNTLNDREWTTAFLGWLRSGAHMRSASVSGALEAARCLVANGEPGGRQIVAQALQRADEPVEALAYWTANYGRSIPKPIKRGIADAVERLWNEFSYLKWNSEAHGFQFADVLDLTHPSARAPWQGDLYKYILDKRHDREAIEIPESLTMLNKRALLMSEIPRKRREILLSEPERLREAGMTWESLAGWLQGPMDKAAWEAIIPSMGYMALLRNLRNFDSAGVSDVVATQVHQRLIDPVQVSKSRQFPFRFYAAYKALGSLRWGPALETALELSLANVPRLKGRTLVLVDQSPSMFPGMYAGHRAERSDMANADVAKLFGTALALQANKATLIGYGHRSYQVDFRPGDAVLRVMEKFHENSGTDAYSAAKRHFDRHDRIVVITDGVNNGPLRSYEQAGIGKHVPIYTWNIGGLKHSQEPGATNRYTFGGLTDAAFNAIDLIEKGRDGVWPWKS